MLNLPPETAALIPLIYSGWHLCKLPAVRRFFRRKIQPAVTRAKKAARAELPHTGKATRESLEIAVRYAELIKNEKIPAFDFTISEGPRRLTFTLLTVPGVEPALINRLLHVSSRKKQTHGDGNVITWNIPRANPAPIIYGNIPRVPAGHCLIGLYGNGSICAPSLQSLKSLLIAGISGSGKTVAMHSLLCSLIESHSPGQLRLLLIDAAKRGFEFGDYEPAPHLAAPIVTNADDAMKALRWAIEEMEARYSRERPVIPLVICIDELAGLILRKPDAEKLIVQLAQEGRAARIHLFIATQHPLESIITTLIKHNLQSKLVFHVANESASRVAMDSPEAGDIGDEEKGTAYFRLDGKKPVIVHVGMIDYESGDVRKIVTAVTDRYTSPGYWVDWNEPRTAIDSANPGYDSLPAELRMCYDIAARFIAETGLIGKNKIKDELRKHNHGISDRKTEQIRLALAKDGILEKDGSSYRLAGFPAGSGR